MIGLDDLNPGVFDGLGDVGELANINGNRLEAVGVTDMLDAMPWLLG